jgi:hypothetical protein
MVRMHERSESVDQRTSCFCLLNSISIWQTGVKRPDSYPGRKSRHALEARLSPLPRYARVAAVDSSIDLYW